MKYPKQCDRLAAFYRAYEATHPRKPGHKTHIYGTAKAEAWGVQVGLQPVPGPGADPAVIVEWERRLEAVVSWSQSAGGAA